MRFGGRVARRRLTFPLCMEKVVKFQQEQDLQQVKERKQLEIMRIQIHWKLLRADIIN